MENNLFSQKITSLEQYERLYKSAVRIPQTGSHQKSRHIFLLAWNVSSFWSLFCLIEKTCLLDPLKKI